MGKLSFIAGLAAGYVLGTRAGRQRYDQIRRTSEKLWNSQPVQRQVGNAKEVAKTKAAPVVADLVADAARATGEKLRQGKTIASEALHSGGTDGGDAPPRTDSTNGQDHTEAWAAATRPTGSSD